MVKILKNRLDNILKGCVKQMKCDKCKGTGEINVDCKHYMLRHCNIKKGKHIYQCENNRYLKYFVVVKENK